MPSARRPAVSVASLSLVLAGSLGLAQTPPPAAHPSVPPTVAAAPGASPAPAAAPAAPVLSPAERARRATVLTHVGDATVTVGEVEDMMNEAPAPVRQSYATPARRQEFVQNLVQSMLLADEARRRGLDRNPETAAGIRRILAQRLEQTVVLESVTPANVTDADVSAYYAAHTADYQQPEFRRATVIFVDDRAAADQVVTAARATHGDMRRLQTLVRERSTEPLTREHDGDLFYFRHNGTANTTAATTTVDPAVAAAAFGLAREMDVAEPVHAANGKWAVVVLTGIRPALSRSLTDVGVVNSIRGFIARQRRTERQTQLLADLRTRLQPEVHEERLDLLHLPQQDLGNMPPFDPSAGPPHRPLGAPGGGPLPGRFPMPLPAQGAPRGVQGPAPAPGH